MNRVLYIEDNPANLRLVQKMLERIPGIDLYSATNAEMGIELARSKLPSLILMDINLPGMNGYQALIVLRDDELTSEIPVIALSANAMTHDIKRGELEDFDKYLTKPFDISEFLKVVDEVVG